MLRHCRWRNHLYPASPVQSSVTSLHFGTDLHTALVNTAIFAAWNSGLPKIHHLFMCNTPHYTSVLLILCLLPVLVPVFSLQKLAHLPEFIMNTSFTALLKPLRVPLILVHQTIFSSCKLYPKCTLMFIAQA